jgi:hypothetical protein
MSVADVPHNDEITAFRRHLMSVLDGHSDMLDEELDVRICSDVGAPVSRSMAMTRQLLTPLKHHEESGGAVDGDELSNALPSDFRPLVPSSLQALGIRDTDVEAIILKFLLNSGPHIGFEIAKHIKLPLTLISGLLRQLKEEKLVF